MKKIMLLHGANLNCLGKRDPNHYGHMTLKNLETLVEEEAHRSHCSLLSYQSNHEGFLIDFLQLNAQHCHGIIINPGAFSHYSYALHDAIVDTTLPTVEVHLSKIESREKWRQHSVIASACIKTISGKKEQGYLEALQTLIEHLSHDKS